jgi:hypothetical protein
MTYVLSRTPRNEDPWRRSFASLADALESSGVPPACWNAVTASHPDEICTFYARPGLVPGGGAHWTVHAPGVAAEFCAAERAAGRLPAAPAS